MELIFKNITPSVYECEITVSGDFNVHLEREKDASILIKLKTSGTKFVDTEIFNKAGKNFDCDFTGYVYPKTIKIISYSKVLKGYVTENA